MKSFLQGKRTIDAAPLRGLHASTLVPGGNASAALPTAIAPQIDIVKQGDKIVRIVVNCSCGERTEIECLYPPGQ